MVEKGSEEQWIEDSRAGDPEAFAPLVARYQKMIHALTFRMTGSLADSEDLAQETFLRAFEQLSTYQGRSKFSSWLYRIAVNACLNWRQRETRRRQTNISWSEMRVVEGLAAEMPPELQEASQRVQDALLRLPAKQRAAIVLTTHEGLDHAEAARVLGCSETTVSWRVFAARSKLKRWLTNSVREQKPQS